MTRSLAWIILLTIVAGAALAEPQVVVTPPGFKLQLVAETGRASSIRSLQLTASEGDLKVLVEPTDLIDQGRKVTIDRSQVRVQRDDKPASDLTLKAGELVQLRVSVQEPGQPGLYTGYIVVRLQQGATKPPVQIPIELTVRYPATTAVASVPATISLQLTNGPARARWLSGHPGAVTDYDVEFNGPFPPLPVESAEITQLRGETSTAEFPKSGCTATHAGNSCVSATAEKSSIKLAFNAEAAQADRYIGTLRVLLKDLDRFIDVPINITVRDHPLWVLVCVLLGVFLGRVWKWVSDVGVKIANAIKRLERLTARVAGYSQEDQQLFSDQWRPLQDLLDARQFDKFDAAAQRAEAWADILEQTNRYIKLAGANTAVVKNLEDLKRQIGITDPSELKRKVEAAAAAISGGPAAPVSVLGVKLNLLTALGATRSAVRHMTRSQWPNKIVVEVALPFVGLIAIILLAFVGFEAVYVKSTGAFGANPVSDYLAALVWGLSTDVIGRNLTSVRS